MAVDTTLPGRTPPTTAPVTSAYDSHDIATTAYTTVAPFSTTYSLPPYEPSLPTPASVPASPPERSSTSDKILHSYDQHRGPSQQPTPPGTSQPWSYSSGMTTGSMEMLEMDGMESSCHSPPEEHQTMSSQGHPSYWGQYTVSSTEGPEEMSPHMAHQPLYPVPIPGVAPSVLINGGSHMTLGPAPSHHVSLLPHGPDPRHHAHPLAHMGGVPGHFGGMGHPHPVVMDFATPIYSSRKPKPRMSRQNRSRKRAGTQSRALPKAGSPERESPPNIDGQPTTQAQPQPPIKHLTLRPEASEADRFLLELRCQMNDDKRKGTGMWNEIAARYEVRYGKKERASLQMQLARTVLKHAVWPTEEDEALKYAMEELEKRRYSDTLKLMKEYGGCRVWDWKEGHIAKRLVELGFDEFDADEANKKLRRQRKAAMRKSSDGGEQQQRAPGMGGPPTVTSDQENYIMEQYCKPERESPEPGGAMEGLPELPPLRGPSDQQQQESAQDQSSRVAKQACDSILAKTPGHMYGSVAPVGSYHRH
ncbi:hypothetical protein GGR56DRAFT_545349 [Xylariaceae sp. FL0804]|nr:hypothetical protein GGR56DRAFT_545349 [Xylariaceae sp. FL0804]